ncbi:tetratricopeptide repeat protein [Flammeovirga sp. SubArs3]|uniref:tetratricopeptide repeat protein n=1 Tax=Flammeovirga sp. SubArs3 TaxID=2995316 RepID=UPI00248B6BBE|nr:tetratricopeptide repeat protein [Flammeovirga sp. SubArs3]
MKPLFSFTISIFFLLATNSSIDSLRSKLSIEYESNKRGLILKEIAQVYIKSNLTEALKYVDEAILLVKEESPSELLGELYHLKGNIYLKQGLYNQAKKSYLQAESIFIQTISREHLFKAKLNLCIIYHMEENYDFAESEFIKLKFKLTKEDIPNKNKYLATIYLNLGTLYSDQERNEEAIQAYYKVINYCDKDEKLLHLKGKALHNLSNQYILLDRLKDAQLSVERSLMIKNQIDDTEGIINSLNILGNLYLQMNQLTDAQANYMKALERAKQLQSPILLRNTYQNIYLFYKEQKDYKKANEYLLLHKEFSDQLLLNDYEKKIDQLETEHQMTLAQQELMDQKEDRELIIYGLILLFLILLFTSIIVFRNSKLRLKNQKGENDKISLEMKLTKVEEEKLKEKIAYKDRELKTNIMHLMQQYETINEVSELLMKIHDKVDVEMKKEIRSIVFTLQSETNRDLWKELEFRFEKVNEEFYEKLTNAYPILTPNDKKMCAYLYLNLSTKDISNITHQSIKTIEVARFRLRKKLDMNKKDIDFQTFFSKFFKEELENNEYVNI